MKLLVVSHERSGTHLTLNSLYESNCVNVPVKDRNKINTFLLKYDGTNILKSHHSAEWFDKWVFDNFKIIYVQRNIFDTLTSMYFYCKRHPQIFGNFGTLEDFVWSTPDPSKEEYSFINQKNFVDRIINHRNTYNNTSIIKVNYETIVNEYDTFKSHMESLNIPVRSKKPRMGEGQYVSPRKGIVGDYKNNMSQKLINDISSYIKNEYGYDEII